MVSVVVYDVRCEKQNKAPGLQQQKVPHKLAVAQFDLLAPKPILFPKRDCGILDALLPFSGA